MIPQKRNASIAISVIAGLLLVEFGNLALAQDEVEAGALLEVQSLVSPSQPPEPAIIESRSESGPARIAQADEQPTEEKSDGGEKSDEGQGKKPGGGTPGTVTRPTEPETPPDPSELEATVGEDGKLQLNFTGQPWPEVLEWLKGESGLTLDWQELPGGYLNLVTHRRYTIEEARSLINRHLLARGYTIIINGELMSVEKIDKLNPAIVPRVTAQALDDRDPYEFVKVSFELEGMLAEDAAAEFAPLKSPNGKLTPLSSSNWLEAMDAVINLRDIRDAVLAQQTVPEEEQLVRPFYLQHVRANDIVNPLRELLGLPPVQIGRRRGGGGGGGFNPGQMEQFVQQMQQMVQQMQQAAQQNQNKGGGGVRSRRQEKIYIVPVERDNAVLVSGPPNKMALVENAIQILDQPPVGGSTAIDSIAETEVYRLAKLDPEAFEDMLHEMGGLSPRTKVQVDKARRTVIVTGPKTDRLIVQLMIEKLDGSSRSFHVIALRKHQADYVAGSIRFMMGMEEEDDSSSRRGFFFYPYGGGRNENDDPSDKFRVDADVEYNRLLLWSNNVELEQVRNLLIELGELPVPGGNRNRRRVYELDSMEDALDLIERLQKAWPSRGPNRLDIVPPAIEPSEEDDPAPAGPTAPDRVETAPADKTASEQKESKPEPKSDGRVAQNSVTTIPSHSRRAQLLGLLSVSQRSDSESETSPEAPAESADNPAPSTDAAEGAATDVVVPMPLESDDPATRFQRLLEELRQKRAGEAVADPDGSATAREPAPIQIRIGPHGEVFLESDDTYALDLLEEVIEEYAPPRRDWKVFELKYPNTWAYGIEVILKDIFKEEMEGDDGGRGGSSYRYDPWYGMYRSRSTERSTPRRMSERKPLKIISDRDTHTILVQGATREQLQMIEELIAVYDKPESTEDHAIRKTQIFKIKHSTAKVIADAVKDVYRDLLSENDKALQQEGRGGKEQRPVERSYTYIYGGGGDGKEKQQPIRFKGLLSIGVDQVSNILIVSASEGLLQNVGQIVEALDEAARPNSAYQVMHVDSRVNTRELQQRLHKIFGPKPPQQNQNQQNKNQQNQPGQNPNQPNGQR